MPTVTLESQLTDLVGRALCYQMTFDADYQGQAVVFEQNGIGYNSMARPCVLAFIFLGHIESRLASFPRCTIPAASHTATACARTSDNDIM